MSKGHIFSGIFMALFLCGSATLSLAAVWQTRNQAHPESGADIIKGEWAALYEDVFNTHLYSYEPSVNSWGLLNYVLFRDGKDGVLVGENGWLFTKEEFDFHPDLNKQIRKKIDYVSYIHDELKKRNVDLIIAPVPSKARLYEDHLGRYDFPSYKKNIYDFFSDSLQKKNIAVADILSAMQENRDEGMFLRTDTHWSPAGAQRAAQAIANTVIAGAHDLPRQKYETIVTGYKLHQGDLLRYIPLGDLAAILGPAPDKIEIIETRKKEEAQTAGVQELLFSETAPPVTLVGTSYSADQRWNFEGFLKDFLQTDILNASDEGMGPFETMKNYLSDESFKKTPPRLIIWEIPERYLTFPYDLDVDLTKEEV